MINSKNRVENNTVFYLLKSKINKLLNTEITEKQK